MRPRLSHGRAGLQPHADCKPPSRARSEAPRFFVLDPGRLARRVNDEFPIRLTEELVLLMLDEHSGYIEMVPG